MGRVRGTATVKRRASGGGARSSEVWTAVGYSFRTRLPGAAKFDALLEQLKAIGVPSAEGMERRAIHSINLARQDVVSAKIARTSIVFAATVGGLTIGSAWFTATPRRKELPGKEKEQ